MFSTIQEPTRNEQISVTTTSAKIADPQYSKKRTALVLRNTSTDAADVITINFGFNPAVANYGLVLQKGESITDSSETGYECWQGSITAICATANGKLSIFER